LPSVCKTLQFPVCPEFLVPNNVVNVVVVDAEVAAAEASLEEQEAAATKIQALFRGIHDRAKVEAMKHEQVSLTSPTHVSFITRQNYLNGLHF